MYTDEDMLMLSGLQHYVFCARQWGLIHMAQYWEDNHLSLEGQWMHRHVDNPFEMGSINGVVHLNSVSLVSHELGVYGVADLLELTRDDAGPNTIVVPRYPGCWSMCPVEFKHGRSKTDDSDRVQLCAQAMCLEEMYGITISMGSIYYGATRRKEIVSFDGELREKVQQTCLQMHAFMDRGEMPSATYEFKCRSCSLGDICMLPDDRHHKPLDEYLKPLEE